MEGFGEGEGSYHGFQEEHRGDQPSLTESKGETMESKGDQVNLS